MLLLLRLLRLRLLPPEQLPLDLRQRVGDALHIGVDVAVGGRRGALLELLRELADVGGAARERVELLDAVLSFFFFGVV